MHYKDDIFIYVSISESYFQALWLDPIDKLRNEKSSNTNIWMLPTFISRKIIKHKM